MNNWKPSQTKQKILFNHQKPVINYTIYEALDYTKCLVEMIKRPGINLIMN